MSKDLWSGETIGAALKKVSKRFVSKVAMVYENGSVTYQMLQETSAIVARALLSQGIAKGEMVAIWMAGYSEWAYLYYGLARIGAVIVPLNTRYKEKEIAYVLNKSKARTLILKDDVVKGKSYLQTLKKLCPELDKAVPGHLRIDRLPYLQKIIVISNRKIPGCMFFEEMLNSNSNVSNKAFAEAEALVDGEDTALLQFTSGTTAQPKGAILYQTAMLRGSYYNNQSLRLSETDCFFSAQPFFHAGGSIHVMLSPVVSGSTIIVQAYFEPSEALRLMEKYNCTVIIGHQPHYIEYLNHPDLKKRRLSLKKAYAFAPPDLKKHIRKDMGIEVIISPYSLTETHLLGTSCQYDDPAEKILNTVGRCQPGIELEIRKQNSKELLPSGAIGEVCFRGWSVMKGYYDDPERTAEVLDRDGWLRTGDLGSLDTEGYLTLVGRVKDMIRVGGENVAAQEVEGYLMQNDKVKQAVVVGAPDPRLGEVCVAFVELKKPKHLTEDEILIYCRSGLASFKVPRRIIFITEWPMTGTGKIQKYSLKKLLMKNVALKIL